MPDYARCLQLTVHRLRIQCSIAFIKLQLRLSIIKNSRSKIQVLLLRFALLRFLGASLLGDVLQSLWEPAVRPTLAAAEVVSIFAAIWWTQWVAQSSDDALPKAGFSNYFFAGVYFQLTERREFYNLVCFLYQSGLPEVAVQLDTGFDGVHPATKVDKFSIFSNDEAYFSGFDGSRMLDEVAYSAVRAASSGHDWPFSLHVILLSIDHLLDVVAVHYHLYRSLYFG